MMIGFWLLLLTPIALLFLRDWEFPKSRYSGPPHPLDILRERYARGEINGDEFKHRKREVLG